MLKCPFKIGDKVIYKPSDRGYGLIDGKRLEIGCEYRIEKIEKENYIVVEGYRNPGGGIYWTEFEKAGKKTKHKPSRHKPSRRSPYCSKEQKNPRQKTPDGVPVDQQNPTKPQTQNPRRSPC